MPPPQRRPALKGPDPLLAQRRRGALLGMAVGNALSVPTAHRPFMAVPFPKQAEGPYMKLMGGGPHELRRGQVTEEVQLAACLSHSLRAMKRYDAADALRRYRAWQPHAFDVSEPMTEVFEDCQTSGFPPLGAGRRVWLRAYRKPADPGSLARAAPLGVYLAGDAHALTQASLEDSALTHFDPRCQLACAAFNAAIGHAVTHGAGLKAADLIPAAESGLLLAGAALGRSASDYVQEVSFAASLLREDLAIAQQEDPMLYGPELHLHRPLHAVRVAFRLAFWELLHAPSAEAALLDVVHRGGDTEAHATITGALLGAFHGEQALPEEWRKQVLEALSTVKGPLWDVYHPRHLLALSNA
ncbi:MULTISPECIES: ADP-ribosylglycohydrolase family protein [Myxococcus]|uniref:ADP-ribosylglycohydrolase family protein n=1 Tax=Myxococcus TaxID=32 RepID=UPI0004782C2F|nr:MULTISPECIES: ADP-ribosylglycohydrolase family protein [Myxococcus]QPM77033.1 ADP-ribosylglycohydrolase family protein [Myxococcus xanthus]QVW66101.1 ADP-ribosylglycohydrolase family protein [Myxococcus xanthus DZ2]UEO07771.1 ADP-ribosylglycohydrolase family protein [Myxococcus xanthus DZ2]UYI11872.1 ADP-ribosylglycohydrolase family protein [Myxococcus xanthus]UYI19241.1 ADP-ribosylglycohydrolase family protein [Myxococcus xanthus]